MGRKSSLGRHKILADIRNVGVRRGWASNIDHVIYGALSSNNYIHILMPKFKKYNMLTDDGEILNGKLMAEYLMEIIEAEVKIEDVTLRFCDKDEKDEWRIVYETTGNNG